MLPVQVPLRHDPDGVAQPQRATCLPLVKTWVTLPAYTRIVSAGIQL